MCTYILSKIKENNVHPLDYILEPQPTFSVIADIYVYTYTDICISGRRRAGEEVEGGINVKLRDLLTSFLNY